MRLETVPDNDDPGPAPRRRLGRRRDPLGPDSEIGARLRALYAEVEREPIPADLIDLLQQLDEAERRSGEA